MEDGHLPANLHYTSPNTDIPALSDGRLKVISERTPWAGGYAGINSFGFGGSNVHVLLRSNPRGTTPRHPASCVPRLVTWSGRTEGAVTAALEEARASPEDVELQALLQETAGVGAQSHQYRGYAIVNHSNPAAKDVQVGYILLKKK